MAKKAQSSLMPRQLMRHVFRLGWKRLLLGSAVLCVFAFFRFQTYSQSTGAAHLPWRSRVPSHRVAGDPKIAFLFLVRRNLPLDFLWGNFFRNGAKTKFSIYIHSQPGFVFDETTTRWPSLFNRHLKNSIKVAWGEASMIGAERLLFEEALHDPDNQRFVLLSDSCVPLYNFSYVYEYLMNSPRSFVDSFVDKNDDRYHPMMSPAIPRNKWRKGSQWVSLVRRHAEVVVDDEIVFPVFQRLCKRRPPLDLTRGKESLKLQKQRNCIPDEHYVQTLLAMSDLEAELERRTVTYTSWNQSMPSMKDDAWHPFTFRYPDSGPQQIKRIQDINHIYYETEFRTEWCIHKSKSVNCFLFARKFSQGAAMRLLSQGTIGKFDVDALLKAPP